MFCEGEKTYPTQSGCPVCGMDLVTLEAEDSEQKTAKNKRNPCANAHQSKHIEIPSNNGCVSPLKKHPASPKNNGQS
jgi:hypothetical protein